MFNLWRRNVRVRQSSVLELGYDDHSLARSRHHPRHHRLHR
jgi:hypothetical protein